MGQFVKNALPKSRFSKSLRPLISSKNRSKDVPLSQQSDEELMKTYKKGDDSAFRMLLSRHERPVFNYLLRYTGNNSFAEEAFQEVFLRVIRNAQDYKPTAKFTTWLYTIARNYAIDHSRKQKFRNHLSLDAPLNNGEGDSLAQLIPVKGEVSAEEVTSVKQMTAILDQVLDELNPEQREVFLMREQQGLQFDEIAKVTKTSSNTVKSRMRYALAAIQKKMAEKGVNRETFLRSAS